MARGSIGQAVRARRRERDMTQEELAASVGVVPTYVNAIECDRRRSVTLDKLHSVVRSLGCRLELVEDDEVLVPVRLSKKTIALLDRLERGGLHGLDREHVARNLIYSALRAAFDEGAKA